jgi:DNA-binding LytR/AlgR family response regulator
MIKIRILALEDDELHADVLRMTIGKLGYELIDIVDNSKDLFRLIQATKPDLLLMDIDIGEEQSGIDLVKKINEANDIPVIYVTSLQEQHIYKKAKETLPDGYVLKPYDPITLQSAIDLCILRKQKENAVVKKPGSPVEKRDTVFVKDGNTLIKLFLKDIAIVEAYDKYCYVYAKEKKYLLNIQLKTVVDHLPSEQFLQVHRSYLINFDAIEKIKTAENIVEIAGKQIPVSKSHKNALFSRLNLM